MRVNKLSFCVLMACLCVLIMESIGPQRLGWMLFDFFGVILNSYFAFENE